MAELVQCRGCERHLRVGEVDCPFCGEAARSPEPAPRLSASRLPGQRLPRAASAALGAAVVVTAVACSDDKAPPTVPIYGAPPNGGSLASGGTAGSSGIAGGGASSGGVR